MVKICCYKWVMFFEHYCYTHNLIIFSIGEHFWTMNLHPNYFISWFQSPFEKWSNNILIDFHVYIIGQENQLHQTVICLRWTVNVFISNNLCSIISCIYTDIHIHTQTYKIAWNASFTRLVEIVIQRIWC